MENFTKNEISVSKSSSNKPYERKIGISQTSQKQYTLEEEDDKKEDQKIIDRPQTHFEFQRKDQTQMKVYPKEENQYYQYQKGEYIKKEHISNLNNIQSDNMVQGYAEDNNIQNEEFIQEYNDDIQEKNYIQNNLNKKQDINIQDMDGYDDQYQYGEDDNEIGDQNRKKYNYKYKYQKIKTTENNIEREDDGGQAEEGEYNEEQNEEDEKEEDDNFDYQEIKKKPGRILHQSTQETFDEEGNRVVTTKTIKEFKQMTGGVRIKNIQNEKERIEYERYTTNKRSTNNQKVYNTRKNKSTNLNNNKGDRVYLLAQLAKLKNDAEKNRQKKSQIYNTSQSPIIIHESDGYENQNSIFSNELIEPNSFEEEMNERNCNYRTNYGRINNNYINNQEYGERYFYPSQNVRFNAMNNMQEEYFGENDISNNRRDIPSPIGYIATYSSGSEDNEEIGRSYDQYNYNNRRTTSKNKIDKNIFKKEGELIKKSEIIYQMEDPNDYNGFNVRKNKRLQNLSSSVIKAQIDTSKSDKRDFQSPDRGAGNGSERFRKVTMAMISSYGPTCEDRKITRKMRNEVGGVVDLRQELNPVNTYKIKKAHRFGNNLNKEVNPKTKLEGARIIQYWWRKLKEQKIIRYKIIKITKIQTFIRRYLVRKRIISIRIIDTIENIFDNHDRDNILKFFKYLKEGKAKNKLMNIIKNVNEKNNKKKILKYFFKYKFISDFLKKKTNFQTSTIDLQFVNIKNTEIDNKREVQEETKVTEITEEMYIKYIKEKYLNNNKSEHISQLSIDKKERKPYEIEKKDKYEVQRIKKELKDEETQDENAKKECKETGTQNEKEEMLVAKEGRINYIQNRPETQDMGIGGTPDCNEIATGEPVSFIKKQKETVPKINEIINQDKISIIYNKPITKEEGIEGGTIKVNEISESKSLLIPKIEKEMKETYAEAKPEVIIELDGKTEISIIKQKKELVESSTQKEVEENKINTLNQISFIYHKPKTTEQGIGGFAIGEGIDKMNINILKEKKEYKDSETEPVKQDMTINNNTLSIIKPVKQLVETDTQYRDPNLPSDKNEEINKIVSKKTNKDILLLGSALNRWKRNAFGEKIKHEIDIQRVEKLKSVFKVKENFLKKIIKIRFQEFIKVCKSPKKVIELTKNDNFNIIDTKPENERIQIDQFLIEPQEKPELEIDKKEDINILKPQKIYKDAETQETTNVVEDGISTDIAKNEIVKNELIEVIDKKKETTEEGTEPQKESNEISSIPSINYIKEPKELINAETEMEKAPQEICKNEDLNIIKPKKEFTEASIQYADPSKRTSVKEILTIIIEKKIYRNNLNIGKYFNKWYKITKEDKINDSATKIIKVIKGYLIRKKMKNEENKKIGLKKYVDIYEETLKKYIKKRWTQFINKCSVESNKVEPKQGDNFSIIDKRPENKEEKINDICLVAKEKEKTPFEIYNLEKLNILGKMKEFKEFGAQENPDIVEEGTQNETPKNEIDVKEQISFLYSKKKLVDEFSQNEAFKPEITNSELKIINVVEKKDEGQQIGSWENTINKNDSINIISDKPHLEEKQIIPNSINKADSIEIIKTKKELCDQEMQFEPSEHVIQNYEIEIINSKPAQEDSPKSKIESYSICQSNSYSITQNKKKETNEFSIDKNTVTIFKEKKEVIEQGEQYDIQEEKNKYNEVIIGSNIKIGNTKKFIEIFEDIWIKKEFKKFIENCKKTNKETMIKRELLRMALLRWRFIKGYGGDRYGIIYDRDGNEIGKREGSVNDVSIQNTIENEIEDEKLRNKKKSIKISQQKPVYIKSNIVNKPKKMVDSGTGDDKNHILTEKIDKTNSISYKKKPKPKNSISGKNYFKIEKKEKVHKEQGTSMTKENNKIVSGNKLSIINKDNLNTVNSFYSKLTISEIRRRELMMQIISKSMIREKYILSDIFSKWYNKTMKIIAYENTEKYKKIIEKSTLRNTSKIIRNEKFQIIHKIEKRDRSVGNEHAPNKIVHSSKLEFRNKNYDSISRKRDMGILIDLPVMFRADRLKTRKISSVSYKSYKKPLIFKEIKGESTSIIAARRNSNEDLIPTGKEIEDEINIRITEIFVKFLRTRSDPKYILRKYLSIWYRNSQYLPLLENAKIISEFCKSNLNDLLIKKKWRKLYDKYLFSEKQYNIMKIIKKIRKRKFRVLRLIRMTRLMTIFNKRKFLHYILMYWLIYTISNNKKRNKIKLLYENMLTTYVSMADDIFGNNKTDNPSIQDYMFEIVDSNKYQVNELEDVPMAKTYYSKKNEEKKIVTNIKYVKTEVEHEKELALFEEYKRTYLSPRQSSTSQIKLEKNEKREISKKKNYQIKNERQDTNQNNSYKVYSLTETSNKDNSIKTEKSQEGTRYGRRNEYKGFSKVNANIGSTNNRYSSVKTEENADNQYRRYNYKGHSRSTNNNDAINVNNLTDINQKEQKKDEEGKRGRKHVYISKYSNTDGNDDKKVYSNYKNNTIDKDKIRGSDNKLSYSYKYKNNNTESDKDKNKYNKGDISYQSKSSSYSNKTKPERKTYYSSSYNFSKYNKNNNDKK